MIYIIYWRELESSTMMAIDFQQIRNDLWMSNGFRVTHTGFELFHIGKQGESNWNKSVLMYLVRVHCIHCTEEANDDDDDLIERRNRNSIQCLRLASFRVYLFSVVDIIFIYINIIIDMYYQAKMPAEFHFNVQWIIILDIRYGMVWT